MTVLQIIKIITILKIALPIIGVLLLGICILINIKKKKNIYIGIIGITLLMLCGLFYVFHDCTKFNVFNDGILLDENGSVFGSGQCMICHKNLRFKDGVLIEED